MQFKEGTPLYSYEVQREGGEDVLYINYLGAPYVPSLSDQPEVMGKTIDALIENSNISRIVFVQQKNYNYDFRETSFLLEIAQLYVALLKQDKILSKEKLVSNCEEFFSTRYNELFSFLFLLKQDPLAAYNDLKKLLIEAKIMLKKVNSRCEADQRAYVSLLERVLKRFNNTKLIQVAHPFLEDYKKGDREIYHRIFKPDVIPNFTFTRLVLDLPDDSEIVDQYKIGEGTYDESLVTILREKEKSKLIYHLTPPENVLSEDHSMLLNMAREVLIEHQPKAEEFVDTERTRKVFMNIAKDLLRDLGGNQGINLDYNDINKLATILVRHTIGFGILEVLLKDKKLQDIVLNAPIPRVPIYLRHQDHLECVTNILASQEDVNSWAAKFRMISGRPLDEANPILDTQLSIGNIRARIAIIQQPLSPDGLAYAIRRHRESPWTLPLFIKVKMLNPFAAGLLSFLIDGSRTMLVAGTRSSGKTSLLGSLMLEIMRKYRVIVIEDSLELPVESLRDLDYNILRMKVRSALLKTSSEVSADDGIRTSLRFGDSSLIIGEVRSSLRGNQEVVVVDKGVTKRIPIKELEKANIKKMKLPTLTNRNKVELKPLTDFVKHPKRDKLLRLTTRTGREVVVTPDHSVFTHINFRIAAINTDQLKVGDPVIIPSKIPCGFNDVNYFNLLEIFKGNYRLENAEEYIREAIKKLGWKKASRICDVSDIYRYLLSTQKTRIPIKSFLKLMKKSKVKYDLNKLRIKKGTSHSIPANFPINDNVLRLIGYYIAEGNIDKDKIQITNSKPEIIKDIKQICKKEFNLDVSQRSVQGYGSSIQMYLKSKPLSDLLIYLGCGKTSYNKRIPSFIYGLNKKKICSLLRGMYSGDGSFTSSKSAGNMVRYFSTSKKLIEDVGYALLTLGIVAKIYKGKRNDKRVKDIFIAEIKKRKYLESFLDNIGFTHKEIKLMKKSFSHSKNDSICFDLKELEKHLKLPRRYRHLKKTGRCSKDYLSKITEEVKCSDEIYDFAHGDFFVDKVKSIEVLKLNNSEHVYDLSVNSTQRFIGGFGGLLLHNTEAKALYEAMRVGALANVVAGTIHGASPYGVFDRVVNDLGVPATSFKATDIIGVCNPIKSPDGLHSWKRLLQLSEIRKYWKKDPLEEGGFVDLLKYNVEKDELEATDDLKNGESEVIKDIAANVKGWAGNWDAVYDNILLRAKIKKEMVDTAKRTGNDKILESEFNARANQKFHEVSGEVIKDIGLPLSKKVFPKWQKWLNKQIKKKKI